MPKFTETPIESLPNERWVQFKTTYVTKRPRRDDPSSPNTSIAEKHWYISDHGRVKIEAHWYTHEETGHIFSVLKNAGKIQYYLMPYYEKGGHALKYQCLPTQEYIHRLVGEAFIPNPENKATINHIDGNKKNNHYTNLEWATHHENLKHAYQMALKTNGKWGRGRAKSKNDK